MKEESAYLRDYYLKDGKYNIYSKTKDYVTLTLIINELLSSNCTSTTLVKTNRSFLQTSSECYIEITLENSELFTFYLNTQIILLITILYTMALKTFYIQAFWSLNFIRNSKSKKRENFY